MKIKALVITLSFALASCATTKLTGISDPKYKDISFSSLAVQVAGESFAQSVELESRICSALTKKHIDCVPFSEIYPPTREFDRESAYQALVDNDAMSILVIATVGDSSSSRPMAFQTFSSSTSNGFGTTYGQSTTMPMNAFARKKVVQMRLLDARARETVWVGEAVTSGQGLANVTDSAFSDSLVSKAVQALLDSPHF